MNSTEAIHDALAKLGDEPSGETMPIEAVGLMTALVERNAHDLHYVTDQLMDGYKHQAETAQATLNAVREEVGLLVSGQWMPTPEAILRALWPSEEFVKHHRKGGIS